MLRAAFSRQQRPGLIEIGWIEIRQGDQSLVVIELDTPALKRNKPAFAEFAKDAVDVNGAKPQGIRQVILRERAGIALPTSHTDERQSHAKLQQEMRHARIRIAPP